jgi:hypothetical protein
MQTFQATCDVQISGGRTAAAALARFGASVMAALGRGWRRDDATASRYEGCSWGDATERAITNDIVNCGCTRF